MAEVGDEVPSYGFQPAQLRDIVYQGNGASGRIGPAQWVRPDLQGVPGGGVKVESLLVLSARQRPPQRSFDRLLGKEVTVARVDQLPCRCVAQHNAALLVADHKALVGLIDGLDQERQKVAGLVAVQFGLPSQFRPTPLPPGGSTWPR